MSSQSRHLLTLLTLLELFVLNYVPHYSFSNSGMWKGQNSPVGFTALFTAFFFCWTFPTFHFSGEGFFCQPWGWWNYFEGSTGVGTGETSFHWNFLIITITPACLTEKWQNWTTTDTLAGTTVYSNICHNYYRVMLYHQPVASGQ